MDADVHIPGARGLSSPDPSLWICEDLDGTTELLNHLARCFTEFYLAFCVYMRIFIESTAGI
jgi:hypothetical protein